MPHISVKMVSGKTEEQKQKLSDRMQQAVMDIIGSKASQISVSIEEIERPDWKKVYIEEIEPKMDSLYKKPGYTKEDL